MEKIGLHGKNWQFVPPVRVIAARRRPVQFPRFVAGHLISCRRKNVWLPSRRRRTQIQGADSAAGLKNLAGLGLLIGTFVK